MRDKHAILRALAFADVNGSLPEVEPLTKLMCPDLFITSLGFEDRCTAISKKLHDDCFSKGPIPGTLICEYGTNREDNRRNEKTLLAALQPICTRIVRAPADRPSDLGIVLTKILADISLTTDTRRHLTVTFDISTASANLILSVMRTLIGQRSVPLSLTIAYAEPHKYFPSAKDYSEQPERLILLATSSGEPAAMHEQGVSDVETNELYPGIAHENRSEFIIAIPSHRTERMSRCLQRQTDEPLADPDRFVYWLLGQPPAPELAFRLELQRKLVNTMMKDFTGTDDTESQPASLTDENSSVVCTLDYRRIFASVLGLVDQHRGKNISLVHMGSKLQAVGISLALAIRREVSVIFAKPVTYNPAQYSEGVGALWTLEFRDLTQTMEQLAKIGTLLFISEIETPRTGLPTD